MSLNIEKLQAKMIELRRRGVLLPVFALIVALLLLLWAIWRVI